MCVCRSDMTTTNDVNSVDDRSLGWEATDKVVYLTVKNQVSRNVINELGSVAEGCTIVLNK